MKKFKLAPKKKPVISAVMVVVLLLLIGSLAYLVASGKISADILSGNSVTADASQGQAFSSPVDAAIATNELKISAIPLNAGFKFDHWQSSSSSCTFLDSTKAITIATTNGSCQMTAKFSVVAMTTDKTGYIEIATASDLDKVRNNLSGKYIQTADIDLAGVNFEPIGGYSQFGFVTDYAGDPKVFKGAYDGNGKTISNLKIDKTTYNTGLFGANGGTIKNVTLRNINILGTSMVGGLVGQNMPNGIIDSVIVNGSLASRGGTSQVYSTYLGTISAVNRGGIIKNSVSNVEINAPGARSQYFGGIAGVNISGLIDGCYSIGELKNIESQGGGIVGYNDSGVLNTGGGLNQVPDSPARIYNSYSNINVTGFLDPNGVRRGTKLGGLIGQSDGHFTGSRSAETTTNSEVKNSFSLGNISGNNFLGGAIGVLNYGNQIDNIYVLGSHIATNTGWTGGLIGDISLHPYLNANTISNSSSNTTIDMLGKGQSIGGFIGQDWADIEINNCHATSTIAVAVGVTLNNANYNAHLGGFFGSADPSKSGITVRNSSSTINLSAPDGANAVGGFIGDSSSGLKVYDSYAKGKIQFASKGNGGNIAGFAGALSHSGVSAGPGATMVTTVITDPHGNSQDPSTATYAVVNCYANVQIINSQNGAGFISQATYSDIKLAVINSYFNKSLQGVLSQPSYGDSKTDAEMKTKSTFTGWDFDNIWSMVDGTSYPKLQNELTAATPAQSPTATASVSSTPSASATSAAYTFHKGFNAFGSVNIVSLDSIKANGLYLYRYDGASNTWVYYPGTNFTPVAYRGYYIYNPSDAKTVTLTFTPSTLNIYTLTKGWNLFWTNRDVSQDNLAFMSSGALSSLKPLISNNKVFKKIYVIDNDQATSACSYFKILGDSNTSADCQNNSPAQSSVVPAGKAFWVYNFE